MAFASVSAIISLGLWSSSQVMNTRIKRAHTPGWRGWMELSAKCDIHVEADDEMTPESEGNPTDSTRVVGFERDSMLS